MILSRSFHSSRTTGAVVAAVAMAVVLLSGGYSRWPLEQLLPLALITVYFELSSPRLYSWGFASLSAPWYLAAALNPELGPTPAALLALVALTLRTAVRSNNVSHVEWVCDALPLLGALLVFQVAGVHGGTLLIALAVYFLVLHYLPEFLIRYRQPARDTIRWKGYPFLVAAVLMTFQLSPPLTLAKLTLTGVLMRVLQIAMETVSGTRKLEDKRLALLAHRKQREQLRLELERIRENAATRSRHQHLMDEVQQILSDASQVKKALSALCSFLRQRFSSRSVVVFLHNDGQLVPAEFSSPEGDRLAHAALTAESEPLVHQAWRESRALRRHLTSWPPKLLQAERSVVALPLGGYAVLYLGRPDKPFNDEDFESLRLVARQATVGIDAIAERESNLKHLDFVSQERLKLSLWLHRLHRMLECGRTMATASDRVSVLKITQETLADLIPHEYFLGLETQPALRPLSPPGDWKEQPMREFVGALEAAERPLLIESIETTRFHPPHSRAKSFLGLPLLEDGLVLMLGDSKAGNFEEEHLDLTMLVAAQVSAAMTRLRLRESYLEASKSAAVGQIAAGLCHELNTPLATVQLNVGAAQMALERDPGKAEQRLEVAEQAVDRAQQILKGLLFYATSYGVEGEILDPVHLVQGVVKAHPAGRIRLEVREPLPRVRGFPLDLEQLVDHLVQNALWASPEREILIDLVAHSGSLVLGVHNAGQSIPREIQDRIFEPFFTTRPVGTGLGLGLAVARRIAEMHEGSLRLVPPKLGGASFELRLPLEARPETRTQS